MRHGRVAISKEIHVRIHEGPLRVVVRPHQAAIPVRVRVPAQKHIRLLQLTALAEVAEGDHSQVWEAVEGPLGTGKEAVGHPRMQVTVAVLSYGQRTARGSLRGVDRTGAADRPRSTVSTSS